MKTKLKQINQQQHKYYSVLEPRILHKYSCITFFYCIRSPSSNGNSMRETLNHNYQHNETYKPNKRIISPVKDSMREALNLSLPLSQSYVSPKKYQKYPVKDNISGVILHSDINPSFDDSKLRKCASPNYQKKNPIIQNLDEYDIPPWKPSIKKSPLTAMSTFNKPSSDEIFQSKSRGLYNVNDAIRKNPPWKPCMRPIKEYWLNKGENLDLDVPRGLKRVESCCKMRDPIVEGDKIGYKLPKPRPEVRISAEYEKIAANNIYKPLLQESRPRLERQAYELRTSNTNVIGIFGPNYKGLGVDKNMKEKHYGKDMQTTLLYKDCTTQRQQFVAEKVTEVKIGDILYSALDRSKLHYHPIRKTDVTIVSGINKKQKKQIILFKIKQSIINTVQQNFFFNTI